MKILLLLVLVAYIFSSTCYAEGDPHVRTFAGGRFEHQKTGDFVLFRGSGLEVQARQRSWGNTASVMTDIALSYNGDRLVVNDEKFNTFSVNGRTVSGIKVGGKASISALTIQRTAANIVKISVKNFVVTVTSYASNGAKWPQTRYLNVVIDTPLATHSSWTGSCLGREVKGGGLFGVFIHHHHGPQKKICTRRAIRRAIKRCKKYRFHSKVHFRNCVIDTCHGIRAKNTREFYNQSNRHKKRGRKCARRCGRLRKHTVARRKCFKRCLKGRRCKVIRRCRKSCKKLNKFARRVCRKRCGRGCRRRHRHVRRFRKHRKHVRRFRKHRHVRRFRKHRKHVRRFRKHGRCRKVRRCRRVCKRKFKFSAALKRICRKRCGRGCRRHRCRRFRKHRRHARKVLSIPTMRHRHRHSWGRFRRFRFRAHRPRPRRH